MSLLSMVEQAIKSCKAEQAKINDSIQLYREILQTLTAQPKTGTDESECADAAATDTVTSPGEKEDMELLEQALEKALRVRTGTRSSKERIQASAASKGNQTTTRSTSKSASLDRKEFKKFGKAASCLGSKSKTSASLNPGQCTTTINRNVIQNCPVSSAGIVHHQAARKSQQAVSASSSLDQGQLHTSTLHSKNKTIRSNVLRGNNLGKAATIPSNNTVPVSHREESAAQSLPRQNGKTSDQTAKWKYLRSKQNRLWDKVVALQRKPAPGRSHFMERMRATFPKDWPCGCPDQTRALVNRLTYQGHDFTQHCQKKKLLDKQMPEAATDLGKKPEQITHTSTQIRSGGMRRNEGD